MKFVCERTVLATAIEQVATITQKTGIKPILQCAELVANKDGLVISATDYENAIRCTVPATVTADGTVIVPAQILARIVRDAKDETMSFSATKGKLTITCADGHYNITCIDEVFPAMPDVKSDSVICVQGVALAGMLRKVSYCAAPEASRYSLNGVCLQIGKGAFRVQAADGRRLAVDATAMTTDTEWTGIIPLRSVAVLTRFVDVSEQVNMRFTDSMIQFALGDKQMWCRLVDGKFPDVDRVIPSDNNKKVVIDKTALLTTLRRSTVLTSSDTASVSFVFSKNVLKLVANAPEVGTSELTMATEGDADMTINFDPAYIADAVKTVDGDSVTLELKDATSAIRISHGNCICVIMPLTE